MLFLLAGCQEQDQPTQIAEVPATAETPTEEPAPTETTVEEPEASPTVREEDTFPNGRTVSNADGDANRNS
jgi:hypothetical protein